MKSLKEMLKAMSDKAIEALALELWESYEDDAEDGIGAYLDVDPREAVRMLDVPFDIDTPELLADALKIFKAGGSQEAFLRAELRQLKAREAEIRAKLKELEEAKPEEDIIDVLHVVNAEGADELRKKLEELDAEGLKKVIRKNHLDRFRVTARTTKAEKLMEFIVERALEISTQGDVFRNYAY